MKLTTSLFALPSLVSANMGIYWSMGNVTSSGLKDITFPMAMPNSKHESGLYYAQQFPFIDAGGIGYTGLQPKADTANGSIIHAVFSSFAPGTTTTDLANCHDGADGGAGVSCAVEIPAPYSHLYHLVIRNTNGTTWTGTLVDAALGNETHIGTYTLPPGSKGISGSHMGFVEWFLFNVEDAEEKGECDTMPSAAVTFYPPVSNSTSSGKGVGKLGEPYPYGGCEEDGNYQWKAVNGGGYSMSAGYV